MKVLRFHKEIARWTSKAHANNAELNQEVKKVVDTWSILAEHLLEISVLLKTQRKLSEEDVTNLERHSRAYGNTWSSLFKEGEDGVFNKLHTLLCHIIPFARKHKMLGLASEESFEATHPRIRRLGDMLKPMVSTSDRANVFVRRLGIGLNSSVECIRREVETARTGKPRGKYNANQQKRSHDTIASAELGCTSGLPSGLLYVDGERFVVKREWLESFEFLLCARDLP